VNHSPSTSFECRNPIVVWSEDPVEYSTLKVFNCLTYYHVNDGKLEPISKKEVFMGNGSGMKDFRIWSLFE